MGITLHGFFENILVFFYGIKKNMYFCKLKKNSMNVSFLLKQYFQGIEDITIDVFDAHSLNDVYQQVLATLTSHFEIEISVLQALSYCFYEILDNVHIHSGKPLGTAITHFDAQNEKLRVLVADDGMGIRQSLAENEKYKNITEAEALRMCLQDSVTDGKGMGFGLYATSRLVKNIGFNFVLHSGHHKLIRKEGQTEVIDNGFWQGTIIYMELSTSKDFDPNDVVGVNVVSNSFADECFAKLLLEMPLENLRAHTIFRGLSPMAERSILVALQRRLANQSGMAIVQ